MDEHDVACVHPRLHALAVDGDVARRAAEVLGAQEDDPCRDDGDERRPGEQPHDPRAGHPKVTKSSGLLVPVRLSKTCSGAPTSGDSAESRIRKPLLAPEYIDKTCEVTVHSR